MQGTCSTFHVPTSLEIRDVVSLLPPNEYCLAGMLSHKTCIMINLESIHHMCLSMHAIFTIARLALPLP